MAGGGNQNQDQERAEHPQGDARAGDGLGLEDPQGAGAHEGVASVRAPDDAGDRPHRQGQLRVHASVPGRRTADQAHRLHDRVHRPRPVRRPELQPVPQAARRDARVAGQGRRSGRGVHRPEGHDLLPPPEGEHGRLGHPPGREAAPRAAGRRDQGDAGRLHGEEARPRVHRLQRLRQHHGAEADASTQLLPLPPSDTLETRSTGTTSTSPSPEPCSTTC